MIVVTTFWAGSAAAADRLIAAVRRFHPSASVISLSTDHSSLQHPVDTLTPVDVIPDPMELERVFSSCTQDLLPKVLLPYLALSVAGSSGDAVVAVGPEIEVLGPLDALAESCVGGATTLVAKAIDPLPYDDRHPDQNDLAESGRFLTSLFVASSESAPMLGWWAHRAGIEPEALGPLLDTAASIFPTTICRDPSHGVNECRIPSGETPCLTIDTTHWHAGAPHLLHAVETGAPRFLLSDHPDLADALADRAAAMESQMGQKPDQFGQRRQSIYREALRRHRLMGDPEPPSLRDEDEFIEWLISPATCEDGLSNLLWGLWATRIDLRSAFPNPDAGPRARAEFIEWARRDGRAQEQIPADLIQQPPTDPNVGVGESEQPADAAPVSPAMPTGVNLAGYLNADLGVGEISRLIRDALVSAGIPVATQHAHDTASRRSVGLAPRDEPPIHPFNVTCINADRIDRFLDAQWPSYTHDRYTTGVFFWEADTITAAMNRGIDRVEEIWTGSQYSAEVFRAATTRPVRVLPIPVLPPTPSGAGRELLGVPADRPAFMFSFDFHSVVRRKNVDGLIRAFCDAVPPESGPVLVCKSINGELVPAEFERLRYLARHRPDVVFVDGYVDPGELSAMTQAADCYVSLHRSEGFGLSIAHAMALGTPVIVTAGTGPADFCDSNNALIVDASPAKVGQGAAPYPPDGMWLDPDHDSAVESIRSFLSQPDVAEARATRAMDSISQSHSMARTIEFLERNTQ